MYHVYIIYSRSVDQYYVGSTSNLEDRLYRHRNSGSKATKKAKDWELKYDVVFASRAEAVQYEMSIKKQRSRLYIESLISAG